ncbi:DUF7281 domain-containing protein [Saccharospirillum salsuginis]|uniref:DUF7281 domain-containing protein n=1 Tax=Saccharospirillum salsuginis TaxID=418750 RepID=A0A918N8I4_9GAMM|nr:hypothetical protein [Saccharospirillum salsuginis]GGX47818.1 hypothetical protein GCM10007392_13360 [Saccharospirillum salsuginis]
MSRPLRAALDKLRAAEQGRLPGSALSKAQKTTLDDFARQTGAVRREPAGRGVIYHIVQPTIVEHHWRRLSPVEADDLDAALPDRATNIGTRRDSKGARHGHAIQYLLLKAGGGYPIWHDDQGHRLDLRQATDAQGAAALAISADNRWSTEGDLWLIENQALFDRLDWLPESTQASALYYGGHLSGLLLDWLAEQPRADRIWFFPDYDGVGLGNYARARARLGDRVSLWLMPNWSTKLAHYGNSDRWMSSREHFNSARRALSELDEADPALALMDAMAEKGLGLEQEAVWLPEPE